LRFFFRDLADDVGKLKRLRQVGSTAPVTGEAANVFGILSRGLDASPGTSARTGVFLAGHRPIRLGEPRKGFKRT